MTALERYIDDLVNDKEPQDDFPKNESSWEELYDLCGRLIAEIVTLRRAAAQQACSGRLKEMSLSFRFTTILRVESMVLIAAANASRSGGRSARLETK